MRTVILVELVIEGDRLHASEVIENMLDAGAFQDAINDCAKDNDCGALKVLVARQITPTKTQERDGQLAANNAMEASVTTCGPGCGTIVGRQKTPMYCSEACCDAGRALGNSREDRHR